MRLLILICAVSGQYSRNRNWRRDKPPRFYQYSYEDENQYEYSDYNYDYQSRQMQHEKFLQGVMRMFNDDPVIPTKPTVGLQICKPRENTCAANEDCSKFKKRRCRLGKCELTYKIVCEEPCEYTQCIANDEEDFQGIKPLMDVKMLMENQENMSTNSTRITSTTTSLITTTTSSRQTTSATTTKTTKTTMYNEPTRNTTTNENMKVTTTNKPTEAATNRQMDTINENSEPTTMITTSTTTKSPVSQALDFVKYKIHEFVTLVLNKEDKDHPFNVHPENEIIPAIHKPFDKNNYTVEEEKLNCKFYSRSGSFDCRDWNAPTLLWDLKRAQQEAPQKIANQFDSVMKYTDQLHPTWKAIAGNIIPPFSNEIITRHMFVYCINRFFIESEEFAFMSFRKREADSMLTIIKIRMYCQIPLTQLRKKLMLEAMQYYSDRIRTRRMLAFVKYVMRLVENEHVVDPKVEIELLAPALSL